MCMHRLVALALVVAGACTIAGNAGAQGRGQGRGNGPDGKPRPAASSVVVQFGFNTHDRDVINAYYIRREAGLPPGLAKRGGDLPPGLEKQLQRNGTLPPGLEKKLVALPVDLERQLTPLPDTYRRAVIGAHLVVLNRRSNLIVDVMLNVAK